MKRISRYAALVAGSLAAALLLACGGDGNPSGEQILDRSVEKMSETTVVYEVQARTRDGKSGQVEVYEYAATKTRRLWSGSGSNSGTCQAIGYDPADGRSKGGESSGRGGTAPDEVEVLGETEYDGVDAWEIRYRYESASVEGPYPVEVTEWIARDDYRLLRWEREIADPFGLVGQLVAASRSFEAAPACPSKPELSASKLKPLTQPRLDVPK